MQRIILVITLSAYMALSVFAQHFSKTFFNDPKFGSFIYLTLPLNDSSVLFSHKTQCDSLFDCGGISQYHSNKGYSAFFSPKYKEFSSNNIKMDKGFLYCSYYDLLPVENKYYWYYSIIDTLGNPISTSKYEMISAFNDRTINYGLEIVKNDEVVLWGNSYDPTQENTIDSIKIVWLRIKKDGTLVSGPHYWKPPITIKFGIATDSDVNSSGNMVFMRESRLINGGNKRTIYEIDEHDTINEMLSFPSDNIDYAQFVRTQDGYVSYTGNSSSMATFRCFDTNGNALWSLNLENKHSAYSVWNNGRNIRITSITDLNIAKDGDILFCGTNSFIDSIYNHITDQKMLMSDWGGGFFGRISAGGKLKWVHYMLSFKNATDCNYIIPKDVHEMPNGDILLGGSIGTSPDTLDFTRNAWLMRLNNKGCFDEACSHVDKWWFFPEQIPIDTTQTNMYYENLVIHPNPFQNHFFLSFPNSAIYPIHYQIHNSDGQIVTFGMLKDKNEKVEVDNLTSGIYFVSCRDANKTLYYTKGIKMQ